LRNNHKKLNAAIAAGIHLKEHENKRVDRGNKGPGLVGNELGKGGLKKSPKTINLKKNARTDQKRADAPGKRPDREKVGKILPSKCEFKRPCAERDGWRSKRVDTSSG